MADQKDKKECTEIHTNPLQPIRSSSLPQINTKKSSQLDEEVQNEKSEVESADTKSIPEIKQSLNEAKKYARDVFKLDIADLLLEKKIKIQKNKKFYVENIYIREIAEEFKQFLIQKRTEMPEDDLQKEKDIPEQTCQESIEKMFEVNEVKQNGFANILSGEIDIMLSSQQPYTMSFGEEIEAAIEERAIKEKSKFWKINNFTNRSLPSKQKQSRTPTRYFMQIKRDPLCLELTGEQKEKEIIKNIKQILKLALYSKIKDEKQFNKKYSRGLKSKMRFLQVSKAQLHSDKAVYNYQGFKPTVLYYIINKNTDQEEFKKVFGAYMNILRPWLLWLNVFMHVVCFNVDHVSPETRKALEKLQIQNEDQSLKLAELSTRVEQEKLEFNRKAEEERKKAEEERKKFEEERKKSEEERKKAEEEKLAMNKKILQLQLKLEKMEQLLQQQQQGK